MALLLKSFNCPSVSAVVASSARPGTILGSGRSLEFGGCCYSGRRVDLSIVEFDVCDEEIRFVQVRVDDHNASCIPPRHISNLQVNASRRFAFFVLGLVEA